MVLRTLAVSHLRRYEAAYAPAWDRLKPDGTNTSMKEGEFSQYLDLVAKEGAWGSALAVPGELWVDMPPSFRMARSGCSSPYQ